MRGFAYALVAMMASLTFCFASFTWTTGPWDVTSSPEFLVAMAVLGQMLLVPLCAFEPRSHGLTQEEQSLVLLVVSIGVNFGAAICLAVGLMISFQTGENWAMLPVAFLSCVAVVASLVCSSLDVSRARARGRLLGEKPVLG